MKLGNDPRMPKTSELMVLYHFQKCIKGLTLSTLLQCKSTLQNDKVLKFEENKMSKVNEVEVVQF